MVHLTGNDIANGNGFASQRIEKIGVIGTGVMGSMFALLLASNGITVSIHDRSQQSMQNTATKAKESGLSDKIIVCQDYDTLCNSLGSPKVFIFSLPHGGPGNGVVQTLSPYLQAGDIVVDASNEDYRVTQKRQAILEACGVHYVGMGISGGFNGARYGPAMMPGGPTPAVQMLLPLLEKIAARDEQGRACVAHIGSGGSGHYVKMIHNGIEHGIMSALCEAWEMMSSCLGMDGDAIGRVFDSWCEDGPLKNNFLVEISGPICRTKDSKEQYLLSKIRDAVVQDANDSEGTGVWANEEAIIAHVSTPSLSAAHNLRLASSDMSQRAAIKPYLGIMETERMHLGGKATELFLSKLHQAVYACVLACFAQGLDLMARADAREGWDIDFVSVVNVWRAGCIIRSDYIADVLERHYAAGKKTHPLCGEEISRDLRRCMPALKSVVLAAVEYNAHAPCFGASLEYLKYMSCTDLPTSFMEAQLDAFGAHGYDLKTEVVQKFAKGTHHDSWSIPA